MNHSSNPLHNLFAINSKTTQKAQSHFWKTNCRVMRKTLEKMQRKVGNRKDQHIYILILKSRRTFIYLFSYKCLDEKFVESDPKPNSIRG